MQIIDMTERRNQTRYETPGMAIIDGKPYVLVDWSMKGSAVSGWDWPRPKRDFTIETKATFLAGGLSFCATAKLVWVDEASKQAGFAYAANSVRNIRLKKRDAPILIGTSDKKNLGPDVEDQNL